MDAEKTVSLPKESAESRVTLGKQNHPFLPGEVFKMRQAFLTSHGKVLQNLINHAMEHNLIRVFANETLEDAIFRWLHHEDKYLPNPVPLISDPFIYSDWKKDYQIYKSRSPQPDMYMRTCDALIAHIEHNKIY